jgi:two-component system response regulator AtoC
VLLAEGTVFPERWLHLTETAPIAALSTANAESLCLPMDGSLSLEAMEQRIISEALARNESNVSLTARVFGTTREKLRYRIQKYGLKATD